MSFWRQNNDKNVTFLLGGAENTLLKYAQKKNVSAGFIFFFLRF